MTVEQKAKEVILAIEKRCMDEDIRGKYFREEATRIVREALLKQRP